MLLTLWACSGIIGWWLVRSIVSITRSLCRFNNRIASVLVFGLALLGLTLPLFVVYICMTLITFIAFCSIN